MTFDEHGVVTDHSTDDTDLTADHSCGDSNQNDPATPYKYDPIARFYYPAPYPSDQQHGAGV
jgi:hypothetical protein